MTATDNALARRRIDSVSKGDIRVSTIMAVRLRPTRRLALAVAFLLLARTAPSAAQGTNKVLAEELFRQGQALMQEERYAEACAKLAESQKLDPGTGTLLNLAVCHERQGKLATAWAEYSEVVTLAQRDGRPDRVAYAQERLAAVEPRLSRLKIELSPNTDVPGLEVRLDGETVGRAALGVAVPIDSGVHSVSASAPGKVSWEQTVDVAAGPVVQAIAIPPLADAAGDASTGPAAPTPGPRDSTKGDGRVQRWIGYGVAGLGVVGVGIGAVFGLNAISKHNESNEAGCEGNRCPPDAAAIREEAQQAGNVSTIAFIAGTAALAGGVTLLLTAPSAKPEPASTGSVRVRVLPIAQRIDLEAAW